MGESVFNCNGTRNGRKGKKSDKINKNQNGFYVQNYIKQLQHYVKEAVTCFLHLAVLT